jgi:hypothetical protein
VDPRTWGLQRFQRSKTSLSSDLTGILSRCDPRSLKIRQFGTRGGGARALQTPTATHT